MLVGREEELSELRLALDDARAGRGRLFLIAGEGGIGKTRLVEAVAHEARPTEVVIAWGRCWEGGGGPPLWPWVQILRSCTFDRPADVLQRDLGAGAADVAQLVPELAQRISGLQPAPVSDSPGGRFRLFSSVLEYLRNAAADGGLVVALDDLHAADEASLRLLLHVAEGLSRSNILLVGTYRDAEARSAPHLHRLLAAIVRQGRRIVLAGLGEAGVALLLERSMCASPTDPLVRDMHHITDGNPFFVQEAVRLLRTEAHRERIVLPEEVHALVRRRLDPVAAPVRAVLAAAAVVGREFDLGVLERVTGTGFPALLNLLKEGRSLAVVEEVGLGRWKFSHVLLQEALYDRLRPSERVGLHRRAGEAVEELTAAHGETGFAELAYHFYEAARGGDGAKAAHYCALAGAAAMKAQAFEEAARQFSRALEALALAAPADEGERCEVLLAMGEALLRASEFAPSREAYRRALKAARAAGSAELLARAAVGFARLPTARFDPTVRSVLEEARGALPDRDDPLLARVLAALAGATPDADHRHELCDLAVVMAKRVGDKVALEQALCSWHLPNVDPGPLGDRLAIAEELLRMASAAGDHERAQRARQWRARSLFEQGDVAGMRADLEVAMGGAEALRLPFLRWGAASGLCAAALLEGRLGDAERLLGEAAAAGDRSGYPDVDGIYHHQLWALRREQGRFQEMADAVRRQLEDSVEQDPLAVALGQVRLALAMVEGGASYEARRLVEPVVHQLLDRPGWVEIVAAALLADVLWSIGEQRWSEQLYASLARWPDRHVVAGGYSASLGSSERYLGQMAALLGRYDQAERHFEAGHRLHQQLGAPAWLARGWHDHGRMLVLSGTRDGRHRARELLARARETFASIGMDVHAERVELLLPTPARGHAPKVEYGTFHLEGEYWAIEYGRAQARLRDSKGLRYLALLLASPGQEVHALDLVVAGGTGGSRALAATRDPDLNVDGSGDAGSVLDPKAKAAYRRRVVDLREEIEEATTHHDEGRLARAQQEMDFVLAELAAAIGLGGRDRKASSDAEKARQSVTRAIRGAVERLAEAHGPLGEHLRATVRTGVYTSYSPDPRAPIEWSVSTR